MVSSSEQGNRTLPNLKRTGMDDALIRDGNKHFAAFGSTAMQDITARGNGDSLLRKIDFNTDHFVATYGPNGDGLNKALVAASSAPSISRRIEQLVTPVTPFFDAAIKASGSFYGLGSASYIDSYNSNNGPYDPSIKNNPSSPYYGDSRRGNVEIGSATATVKGDIYGDVATNGGTVVSGSPGIVYGTIDNNVPFVLEDFRPDTSLWLYQPQGTNPGQLPASIASGTTLNMQSPGTSLTPVYYLVSSIGNNLTINPAVVSGNPVDTYVAIHVTGNISGNNAGISVNSKGARQDILRWQYGRKSDEFGKQKPERFKPVRWEFTVLRHQSGDARPDANSQIRLRRWPSTCCRDVLCAERGFRS